MSIKGLIPSISVLEDILQYKVSDADISDDELNQLYKDAISRNAYPLKIVRLACKIIADPYFRRALNYYRSTSILDDTGFMDDGLDIGIVEQLFEPTIETADLTKLKSNLVKSQTGRNLALIATGAFAPIHEAHIDMLEKAREVLEQEGNNVVGGFLAPEHDAYLIRKANGADAWSIDRRIEEINKRLNSSDWLSVDVWSGVNVPTDVKYTDVIRRSALYLSTALRGEKSVEVIYVFGGDHAKHARTFISHGKAVCVNRARYSKDFDNVKTEFTNLENNRVIFVDATPPDISSTQIRQGMI